jgi:hypothetical protein
MRAKLRRVQLRADVTTAVGESKPVFLNATPGEPAFAALAPLVVAMLAAEGLELVDGQESPIVPASPNVDPASLTVPVVVVAPDSRPLPSASVLASPSASSAPSGDLNPAVKRKRVFGNAKGPGAAGVVLPTKHVVQDAHRRIEPTRNERADVVIGPRDMAPVNGGTLRVSSAHVVGQQPYPAQPLRRRERSAGVVAQVAPEVVSEPDYSAPVIKRRR